MGRRTEDWKEEMDPMIGKRIEKERIGKRNTSHQHETSITFHQHETETQTDPIHLNTSHLNHSHPIKHAG